MRLIVGLGNPEAKYRNTRHNIGYMMLDTYAKQYEAKFKAGIVKTSKREIPIKYSNDVVLLKPFDGMNNSGKATEETATALDIPNEDVLVLHDDTDLSFGRLKVKAILNNGRHRGTSDIGMRLGTTFGRVKIGIGKPEDQTLIDYVLSPFTSSEYSGLCMVSKTICDVIDFFIAHDIDATMAQFNHKEIVK